MEQLIANYEAGIEPCNWFDDYVAVTVSNEGSYCRVAFMKVLKIYPAGGRYAAGSYSLRLSDGDVGTLYTGRL